jgi:Flp pilus assembly protein protease CpaA
MLGATDAAAVAQSYGEAFSTLTSLLCAVTIVTALFVVLFLRRREKPTALSEESIADSLCPEAGVSR